MSNKCKHNESTVANSNSSVRIDGQIVHPSVKPGEQCPTPQRNSPNPVPKSIPLFPTRISPHTQNACRLESPPTLAPNPVSQNPRFRWKNARFANNLRGLLFSFPFGPHPILRPAPTALPTVFLRHAAPWMRREHLPTFLARARRSIQCFQRSPRPPRP